MNTANIVFETSWEVCNKVGGIHTVIMTKSNSFVKQFNGNYFLIGPDLGQDNNKNSEFVEDNEIFKTWKTYAKSKGIRMRIGHWNINSSPTVILVDFTQYFAQKNEIFAWYWEKFQVDSLTGGWDYIEPFLFGYAAAKVIENYYDFYSIVSDQIVAQFHEWMTGSGILYLKYHTPQIATIFTTHATVLGRCLAGNNIPLYSGLENINADNIAKNFNVVSKNSLERISALNADAFTTVSELTNRECKHFFNKNVDFVTPNGFEGDFIPSNDQYPILRSKARKKILSIIESEFGYTLPEDSLFIINSGRYEFKNKGIDLFIKSMAKLNKQPDLPRKIVAVIAVPAGEINDMDPIVSTIKACGLDNKEGNEVTILFLPFYLDGNDGKVNISYFDFLTAFDLSIFPSYYEPWGYTPMESMALGIPSITTTLTGFGLWVKDNIPNPNSALTIIERNDTNDDECIDNIATRCNQILSYSTDQLSVLHNDSINIFKHVQWNELVQYYYKAYDLAISKALNRFDKYKDKKPLSLISNIHSTWGECPNWKKFLVKVTLPERLKPLQSLVMNLWWSWSYEALDLFYYIDREKFLQVSRSPIRLLMSLNKDDYERLLKDEKFLEKMDKVVAQFNNYLTERKEKKNAPIAYFSMEFGIHDILQIFSGGLGMLAGDYLKQASDDNRNIVGIGLLYRQGYFSQHITKDGVQESERNNQHFSLLPLRAERDEQGVWRKISINLPYRTVYAKIWRCDVGVTPLYLLDTDIDANNPEDRQITYQLYGGNNEMRLKQEILLGIGGIRLLKELNINAKLYHLNEGHSAFCSLERLNNYINIDKIDYFTALEKVRCSTLFTTHTPVPAGHDSFSEDLMRTYFSTFSQKLNLSWDNFMLLGRKSNNNREDKFSVSVLAINCSENINGVSRIHSRVSKQIFQYLYDGYFAKEINIGYVTNGVHQKTWAAKQWYLEDENYLNNIENINDERVWQIHQQLKSDLITFLKQRLEKEFISRAESPDLFIRTTKDLNEETLLVGFARRFATYKRANLLFTDLKRLEKIVNLGVKFVFAGKAHPADIAGQDLIKNIIKVSKMPQFVGKILFVENYDMFVSQHLIRGVDVWLNTPTRPLEASGTSGEKAVMNGVVNFSVMDGWWAEGYREDAGWALSEKQTYKDTNDQNLLDAEVIYSTLENKILPTYMERNKEGIPEKWVRYIKNTIHKIAPNFTMQRQLNDYFSKYYNKMFVRTDTFATDNNNTAKEYARWKQMMRKNWNTIDLISVQVPDSDNHKFNINDNFKAQIVLSTIEIDPKYIGIEMIITNKENDTVQDYNRIEPFKLVSYESYKAIYEIDIPVLSSGVHDYAFRLFAQHPLLSSRMDLPLVKWI